MQLWGSSSQSCGCEGRKAWGRVSAGGAWPSSPSCCAQGPPLSSPWFIHCSSPSAQGTGRKFPCVPGGDLPEHTQVHRAEVGRCVLTATQDPRPPSCGIKDYGHINRNSV